jgi:hypothetical protein
MDLGLPLIASIMIDAAQELIGNERVSRITRTRRDESDPLGELLGNAVLAIVEPMDPHCV